MRNSNASENYVISEKSSLAFRIRQLRKAMGKTLLEFGKLAGLSDASLSRIETGKQEPTALTLTKIAHAGGLTLSQLLEDAAPILQPPDPDASDDGMKTVEKGGREMRVAQLCAAVNRLVKEEQHPAEAAVRMQLRAFVPDIFDNWNEQATLEIHNTIEILKMSLKMAKRRTSKKPA